MAAADVAECRDKHQNGEAVRERDGRSWLTTSAIAAPAPMKISAKVPMNSAVKVRNEPVAVSVNENYLELSPGERTLPVRADIAGPAQITRLRLTYIAGDREPVNLRKSS
jgi:hypothetical protein